MYGRDYIVGRHCDGTTHKIEIKCVKCGKRFDVLCSLEGSDKWLTGTLIQDALPELSTCARDALITGLCPECQD